VAPLQLMRFINLDLVLRLDLFGVTVIFLLLEMKKVVWPLSPKAVWITRSAPIPAFFAEAISSS
jgi:hypothetical protein